MAEFKVGDRVKIIYPHEPRLNGAVGTIDRIDGSIHCSDWENHNWTTNSFWMDKANVVQIYFKEKTSMSTLLDRVSELTLGEPLKSFVKTGLKDKQNRLTEEGKEVLLNVLANQKDTETLLKGVADQLLAEDKANKK